MNKLIWLSPKANYCNICSKWFPKFNDFGVSPRSRVYCPDCKSLERHRLQWQYLKNKTDILNNKGLKLLHIAPERTFYDKLTKIEGIEYTGIDLDPSYRGLSDIVDKGDVRNMDYEDNTFDVIICNHVLEHVNEDGQAMREIGRVLKKSGFAIVDVPIDYKRRKTFEDPSITDPGERLKIFGQHDHVRIYGTDFFSRLKSSGLNYRKINYFSRINPIMKRRMSLMNLPIIIVTK